MTDIQSKLVTAWRLRFDQRNDECMSLWYELKDQLKLLPITLHSQQINSLSDGELLEEKIECIVLQASLARFQKRFDESKKILRLLQATCHQYGVNLPSRFHIETGLNQTVIGDFSEALESFLTAKSFAKDHFTKLCALSNALCCFDQLGIPYGQMKKEFWQILKEEKETLGTSGILSQVTHLEEREKFRHGKLKALYNDGGKNKKIDQTSYLKLWLAMVPYHSYYNTQTDHIGAYTQDSATHFQKGFRARTLLGILHPDDTQVLKPSEQVDRVYAWLWKWLLDPDSISLERLMLVLRNLTENSAIMDRLTAEDIALLRNAVLWLNLFDADNQNKIQQYIKRLQSTRDSNLPLLSLEYLVVSYLTAKRDHNDLLSHDYLQNIEMTSLWNSDDLHFKKLIRFVDDTSMAKSELPSQLQSFGLSLRSLCGVKAERPARFVIDLTRECITDSETNQTFYSAPICRAVHICRLHGSVTSAQFMDSAFGIKRWDPHVHSPKLFNLIQRMKVFFSEHLVLKTRNNVVFSEGNWENFTFFGFEPASLLLKNQPLWQSLLTGPSILAVSGRKATTPVNQPKRDPLTRRDLEAIIGKSRATVTRLLSDWENKGWIERSGQARSTTYVLNEEAWNSINGAFQ